MSNRVGKAVTGAALALTVAACGSPAAPPAATTAPAASTAPAATPSAAGRVFFVSPKNGATIKPLSTVEFGSSGVTVAAVPPGELTAAQVRPQTIHYHLGTDTDCLPAGTYTIEAWHETLGVQTMTATVDGTTPAAVTAVFKSES